MVADDSTKLGHGSPKRRSTSAVNSLALAQAVSVTGTQVTALALPTLAILSLKGGPLAASLLFALEYGVQGLASPLIGVLVDRVRSPRRLLATADVLQVLVVASVPIGYAADHLTLALLYVVAAVSGLLGGIGAVGTQAVVPLVVSSTDQLVTANARLAGARAVGQIAGPSAAGALVQLVGAATAMVADAVSYGASAVLMLAMPRGRARSRASSRSRARDSGDGAPSGTDEVRREGPVASLRDGFAAIRDRPVLIRLAVAAAALNLGGAGLGGLYVFFAYRILHLRPAEVGLTFIVYSVAALVAVATAKRVIQKIGAPRVIPVFGPVAAGALFLIPLAAATPALATLIAYEAVFGYCATVWMISSNTLQQQLAPPDQLGRVIALSRSASLLVMPVGALGGGMCASLIGITPTLAVFAAVAVAGMSVTFRRRRCRTSSAPVVNSTRHGGHWTCVYCASPS